MHLSVGGPALNDECTEAAKHKGGPGLAEEHRLQEETTGRRFLVVWGIEAALSFVRAGLARALEISEKSAKRVFVRVRLHVVVMCVWWGFCQMCCIAFSCADARTNIKLFRVYFSLKLARNQRNREEMKW